MQEFYETLSRIDRAAVRSRDLAHMQEKTSNPHWGNTMNMEVMPEAHEMLAYLMSHKNLMSEWEQNFVSSMAYWLKVRKKEPDQVQLMMLSVIYNRLKSADWNRHKKKTDK